MRRDLLLSAKRDVLHSSVRYTVPMGNESFINKVLRNEKPPTVASETVDRDPTEAEIEEMQSLLKRVSEQRVEPEEETMSKEDRLARSREILREMVAESRRKEAQNKTSEALPRIATEDEYAKWTDPRYHNGREEKSQN